MDRPHQDAVALGRQLVQQVRITLLFGHRPLEADDAQPAIETIAAIAVVAGDLVTREQEPRVRPEIERILVFTLRADVILAGHRLEKTIVLDRLAGQVGKDVGQLAKQLCLVEAVAQVLP